MRIIRDIFPMNPQKQNVQEIIEEITRYDSITKPYLENFVTNKVKIPLVDCFHEFCIKTHLFFSNIFSDTFFSRLQEKKVLKKIKKQNEKNRKNKIQKTVRSYKGNFEKFNNEATCFEKVSDCFQKDFCTDVYSREQHKTNKNRKIERHWKND